MITVKKLKEIAKKPLFLKAAVGVGLAAMAIILLSGISRDSPETPVTTPDEDLFSLSESYALTVETKLSELLSQIEGVGEAKVMVTVGASEEYVYASDGKNGTTGNSSEIVIIDGKDGKEALRKKIYSPKITGVVIACKGGDDSRTVEKVMKAVSTALGIGASRIYVVELK
jgi:stage III sporulation protein AG